MIKTLIALSLIASHFFLYFEEAKERAANPIDKLMRYKTEIEMKTQPKNEQEVIVESYKEDKYEIFEVTAYTAYEESTSKTPKDPLFGITASGKKVEENRTAACPKTMPFGTELYIPYFDNTFVCEDRGGAIKEGKLDIYMEDLDDALAFGRRNLKVLVIYPEDEVKED
ncbi:3D domain-containing protein [Paenibacillus xylaniclasticus]|uniref:3D domain-containing protein n=1 Tax=Paenibacillus xylaniclasticus TaxID=588083 RepID=UPI001769CBF8|nr:MULTISPECIES: 3D domain-containing protein [Paenibacillus]GFN32497.1 hypothetical protein PCURB6_27570 [Paenibacillus curdlanolyticus]